MRSLVLSALALSVLAAGGCRYVDRLDTAQALSVDAGFCGANVVVDQRAALWREHGCENGRPIAQRVRRPQPDELARLHAVMARLPRDRERVTQAEYAEVLAVFESLTRVPYTEACGLPVFLTSVDADGTSHVWAVEPCERRAIE